MTTLLASLEYKDHLFIAVIVAVVSAVTSGPRNVVVLQQLRRQINELERKLDALLNYHGIEALPPVSDISAEVRVLAQDPRKKIAAIKLYRQEHPGVGLAEAKERIEELYETGR